MFQYFHSAIITTCTTVAADDLNVLLVNAFLTQSSPFEENPLTGGQSEIQVMSYQAMKCIIVVQSGQMALFISSIEVSSINSYEVKLKIYPGTFGNIFFLKCFRFFQQLYHQQHHGFERNDCTNIGWITMKLGTLMFPQAGSFFNLT